MSSAALVLVAFAALLLGAALGWLLAGARERARGEGRVREAELRLREADGTARAGQATAEELRRSLGVAEDRAQTLSRELQQAQQGRAAAETMTSELRRSVEEQKALLVRAEEKLVETFRGLAAQALAANNQGFLTLAAEKLGAVRKEAEVALAERQTAIEGMLKPVKESLDRVDAKFQEIERDRGQAQGRLTELLRSLGESQAKLSSETANLVQALRAPAVRGRWGEIQLKRVVELAGMLEHCDFVQQATIEGQEGRLRPDVIVKLPGGREVVVDAKVPLQAYLDAIAADSETGRKAAMVRHAAQLRAHVANLSAKSYWAELACTPEFVVMFLPGEAMYSAALQEDPTLIEEGVGKKVLIATPTTLIALLQAAYFGWHQERLADNARAISDQGRELHSRLAIMFDHWAKIGAALEKATESYNRAVASFEGRVKPALRKLEDLGARSEKSVEVLEPVEARPRALAGGEETGDPMSPDVG